jgi:hypothetical protein
MNYRVEKIEDESDDQRQQHIQTHVLFLACRLPLQSAHYDMDWGSITPCEKNTSPANMPKNPINSASMSAMSNTLCLVVFGPVAIYCAVHFSY